MEEIKKSYIKSAGLVNGEWKVILSDDSELQGLVNIKMDKDIGNCGVMVLEIYPVQPPKIKNV